MEEGQLKQYNADIFSFTEKGKRLMNEDRIFCKEINSSEYLFLVADGMGGHEHGNLAAEIAIKVISENIISHNAESIMEQIEISFLKAHNAINNELENAGTTIAGAMITDQEVYVFWLGDVKVILHSENQDFISKEHNLLNLLKDLEITIKPEEIKRLTNTVVRSLGGKSNSYSPEIIKIEKKGSLSGIICTDGLSQFFSNNELLRMLTEDDTNKVIKVLNSDLYKNADDNVTSLAFFLQ